MKRICVFGDSHVAALKKGWDQIAPEHPERALTFFPAPVHMADGLAVSDGAIVAAGDKLRQLFVSASRGLDRIAADYDHYLVCGYGLTAAKLREAYLSALNRKETLSEERFLSEALAALRRTAMMEILTKFRAVTARPITTLAAPIAALDEFWQNLDRRGHNRVFVETFFVACARFAAEFDAGFVPQPKRTLHPRGMTRPRYARDAIRLSTSEDDGRHMNADYGAIVLGAALDSIA